jgi:hypothetical protein
MSTPDLSVILLHADMHDKRGKIVTTSLTMIDVHDLARSSRTYGATSLFIAHPAPALRKLANTLRRHWQEGFGAHYNPNRKDALSRVEVVDNLDQAISMIDLRTGKIPHLIATSAREGAKRDSFKEVRQRIRSEDTPFVLMLGTGWGMSDELLARAEIFLEPIRGPGDYNHLSVRSAGAIMLDRLLSP